METSNRSRCIALHLMLSLFHTSSQQSLDSKRRPSARHLPPIKLPIIANLPLTWDSFPFTRLLRLRTNSMDLTLEEHKSHCEVVRLPLLIHSSESQTPPIYLPWLQRSARNLMTCSSCLSSRSLRRIRSYRSRPYLKPFSLARLSSSIGAVFGRDDDTGRLFVKSCRRA